MKVLVTGSRGQLGSKVAELLSHEAGCETVATDHQSLDVTREADIRAAVQAHRPDWIVNCTAYNDVEKAEDEPENHQVVVVLSLGVHHLTSLIFGSHILTLPSCKANAISSNPCVVLPPFRLTCLSMSLKKRVRFLPVIRWRYFNRFISDDRESREDFLTALAFSPLSSSVDAIRRGRGRA